MWFRGLADTDADGKMNIHEFSIACKLINLKLRGFELPKTLPPLLIQSLAQPIAAAAPVPAAAPPLVSGIWSTFLCFSHQTD